MKGNGLVSVLLVLLIFTLTYFATDTSFSERGKTVAVGETYGRASDLYRQDRIEDSLRLISKGLSIDPKSVAWHNLAGWCHYRLSNVLKAEAEFLTSRDMHSTNVEASTGLGYVKIGKGEDEKALDYFREALKISPKDRDAVVRYGICLYNFGLARKAKEVFEYLL
ncbi:MAG: tetratricopeptide repeat protein [Candidatus Zixiibacteriota bacterium]